MERAQKEIEEQALKAANIVAEEGTRVRGMSYEEGVQAALDWAMGMTDDPPIED